MDRQVKGRAIWLAAQHPEIIEDIRNGRPVGEIVRSRGFSESAILQVSRWFKSIGGTARIRNPPVPIETQALIQWDLTDVPKGMPSSRLSQAEIAQKYRVTPAQVFNISEQAGLKGRGGRSWARIVDHFTPEEMLRSWEENKRLVWHGARGYYHYFKKAGFSVREFETILYDFFVYGLRRFDPRKVSREKPFSPQSYATYWVRAGLNTMLHRDESGRISYKQSLGVENPLYGREPNYPILDGSEPDHFLGRTRAESAFDSIPSAKTAKPSVYYVRIMRSLVGNGIAQQSKLKHLMATLSPMQKNVLKLVLENPQVPGEHLAPQLEISKEWFRKQVNAIVRKATLLGEPAH